ncbi:hypothetical protein ACJRO7_016451 [Eucalyptus globulus]|uniref:CCHC-type domain-containing protein n=1 Tax=Eucalyptus globulus TaxID=34317 RepID=A0ABD3L735_EUCGL
MNDQYEEERRVHALCKSLGKLWSEEDVVDVIGEIREENLTACSKTLFGKLFSKPNVNYQAFTSVMKKAWKVDNVTCTTIEPGYFSFSFQSEAEKQRVLDSGPWSFSSNLLVLQECEPDTPEICYDFTHCAFWVNLLGLPLGRTSTAVVRNIASKIGEVLDVKLEAKGNSSYKTGKARVKINLEDPLKTGVLVNLDKKRLWVEFKYERLPHYCYSCGKIGHYATDCKEFPYDTTGLAENLPGRFGHWLRAEGKALSPYGKIFYGKQEIPPEEDEQVPETPIGEQQNANAPTEENYYPTLPLAIIPMAGKDTQKRGSNCLDEESEMVIYEEQQKVAEEAMQENSISEKGLIRKKSKSARASSSKKGKRFCPYGANTSITPTLEHTQLVETPITVVAKSDQWALVASPNKPPNQP